VELPLSNRTAAARYARALLDVARSEADPRAVENELASFVALIERHEPLKQVLTNPSIPAPKKVALVKELAARGGLSAVVGRLLGLLAERDRMVLLPDLLAEYRRRLLDLLNVVRAEVVTAVPLAADRAAALEQAIVAMTGRTVSMSARVDPTLIGGVVTRIGSVVYDGSVKRQLEKVKETLTRG
jgi:F-type H+-transporting ATPase subunit delta